MPREKPLVGGWSETLSSRRLQPCFFARVWFLILLILKPHRHWVRLVVSAGLFQIVLSALTALAQESVPPALETYRQAPASRLLSVSPSITTVTPSGASRQVNVNASGGNIPGDAANEPSMCIDPTNPNRIAVG